MDLMVLKILGFFLESCLVDHLVKLIDQTVFLSGFFHPPCFEHLFNGSISSFSAGLSMAFSSHEVSVHFVWRDFFIHFPLLCLALGRVNWALFGLILFFVVSLFRDYFFLTYNSISRSFSYCPYLRCLF